MSLAAYDSRNLEFEGNVGFGFSLFFHFCFCFCFRLFVTFVSFLVLVGFGEKWQ